MESHTGWQQLLAGYPWFEGEGHYPLPAYSEFIPPPRLGRAPLWVHSQIACRAGYEPASTADEGIDPALFSPADPYGWQISEIEEEYELKPGLEHIARQIMDQLLKLGQGQPAHLIAGHQGQNLQDNPYWPPELAAQAGRLAHERYVMLMPLALSRTQDDKGRVRWTFFGASEQGPEHAFWQGFYSGPGQELPAQQALSFLARLLAEAYGEPFDGQARTLAGDPAGSPGGEPAGAPAGGPIGKATGDPDGLLRAGFRILPTRAGDRLPSWAGPYLVDDAASWDGVRYLLTFRPFSQLPAGVRERYLSGRLALLPFPGSLVFWGMPTYRRLQKELPLAMQISLLHLAARHNGLDSLRVPQSGWLVEPHPDLKPSEVQPELLRHNYARTHRWQRLPRHVDELAANPPLQKVARVLFSTALDVIGLYDKPMARNSQLWTRDFRLLLDGPNASREQIHKAEAAILAGGLFGYRFLFPAMRVGLHEVYWQRPLAAYSIPQTGEVHLIAGAPSGYLTAYRLGAIDLQQPVELWPRLSRQEVYLSALHDFSHVHDKYAHQTSLNILTLLDAWRLLGKRPLPRSFAASLLRIAKDESLEDWLASLPERAADAGIASRMQAALAALLEPAETTPAPPAGITYAATATRAFEEAYWNEIYFLTHGKYINKDNADRVLDAATQQAVFKETLSRQADSGQTVAPQAAPRLQRDLEPLGDYLLGRYRQMIAAAGMEGKAQCGELPFQWQTDFDFPLFGGWKTDHEGQAYERDLLVVIPGKDRSQAVVMADHYDTAYMEDEYDTSRHGSGARLSAAGADDNHSATVTLLQAAPIYLKLAKEGRLERDIWLLHLTGEEFPSDCMGARYFCQSLVEKSLQLRLESGQSLDLSGVEVVGVCVMDMIAHNRDNALDIFQISPGKSPQSLALALCAHQANEAWNAQVKDWNRAPERVGRGRGKRSSDGSTIPETAAHLALHGEVRTMDDPQSSLFNTDGQIFSDTGAPVVLFMENYDINRTGYHDTHDTMENIDLDYGAALAAIAIETVARAAS